MADKFTDNLLTQFQLSMLKDFQKLQAEGKSINEISKFIREKFEFNLRYNQDSSLYGLPDGEWQKAKAVLDTFLVAVLPKEEASSPQLFFPPIMFTLIQIKEFKSNEDYCYCSTLDAIFYWSLLDSLTYHHHLHGVGAIAVGGVHDHSAGDALNNVNDKDKANLWAFLLLLLLCTVAIILTLIALAYLFVEFFDSMERLWHNEGLWQAMISMLSAVAFGAASGWLTAAFLAAPITALAVAAGANPVGMVILGVICLTLIGAGAGCFITNTLQTKLLTIRNSDALDPTDSRFTLTKAEEANLIEQNLDPIKVKCAIAALRQKLGKGDMPYYITRLFNSDKQEILDQVRDLRRGKLAKIEIEVGGVQMNFDLRPLSKEQYQASNHDHYNSSEDTREEDIEPSDDVPPPYFVPYSGHHYYPQQPQQFYSQQQHSGQQQFYPQQQHGGQQQFYPQQQHDGHQQFYSSTQQQVPFQQPPYPGFNPYIPQGCYPYQPGGQQPIYQNPNNFG
ncbi:MULTISPECIES: hypothetical protein [Legionella]|uniref:Uncharacterized protein n=1 Tax=Legionella drozanskii LLAP-1 TaxID=1212489 RepID=A0A0W0SSS8_9GAMM|nr:MULTISPECIES: hypothetical protein [Legionella]KTC86021.1 hypothetical protein Ldro_2346 [Legionella drozanskii LLAP-1]PJE10022.1 MAG: hypothetical protein CK430_10675 [Legionella sp.]